MLGIDGLNIDTVCVDEQSCASLASTFGQITAWSPSGMSTHIANPKALTPVAS